MQAPSKPSPAPSPSFAPSVRAPPQTTNRLNHQPPQERETALSAALAEAQASLGAMQRLHTATNNQLFAIQSQSEEEHANRQARGLQGLLEAV